MVQERWNFEHFHLPSMAHALVSKPLTFLLFTHGNYDALCSPRAPDRCSVPLPWPKQVSHLSKLGPATSK